MKLFSIKIDPKKGTDLGLIETKKINPFIMSEIRRSVVYVSDYANDEERLNCKR